MTSWLGQCSSHNNNFNLLRFFAASLVLYSHSYAFATFTRDPLSNLTGFLSFGSLAVDIFFITSGFLVASSLFGRKNIFAFVWARALRIYPALIVAVIFCVYVIGLSFTELSVADYLRHEESLNFLLHNSSLINVGEHRTLPGVFSNKAVNGSLWTLPWELKMYSVLALVGALLYARPSVRMELVAKIGLLIFAAFSVNEAIFIRLNYDASGPWDLTENTRRFQAFFFIGTSFYILRDKIPLSRWLALPMILAMLSVIDKGDAFCILYILFLPYVVLYIAYLPSGWLLNFNRLGDYSYGIYIYAFPVQRSIQALYPDMPALMMFFVALPITLLLSIISWHKVEKPMLKKKDGYIWLENMLGKLKTRSQSVIKD